jgi:hypothetical protein
MSVSVLKYLGSSSVYLRRLALTGLIRMSLKGVLLLAISDGSMLSLYMGRLLAFGVLPTAFVGVQLLRTHGNVFDGIVQ